MLPDDKIGRYRIVNKIGEGGMGEVYLAEDVKLGRRVALKILPARVSDDPDRLLRFQHEARSASALSHPNIVTIYEIGDEDGSLYIAMEHVEGRTLGKMIRGGELDLRTILDVAVQVAGALAASHQANVVHRDIKPDNIIIRPDGLVKVLDFGLAKLTEKPTTEDLEALSTLFKTSPGLVVGTVGYMSPEQARGREVDGRSDIFSFGSILYEMLSGRRPFTGENEVDIIASIIHKEPEGLDLSPGSIESELESLIRRALRKDRNERYQDVADLLTDLRDLKQRLTGDAGANITADLANPITLGSGASRIGASTTSLAPTSSVSAAIVENARVHPLVTAAIFAALIVGLGFLGTYGYRAWTRSEAFQTMRFDKLTASGNVASEQIAISPDGKYIAYVTIETEGQSLWVKQTAGAASIRVVPAAEVRYDGLTFSPDGVNVYYTVVDKSGSTSVNQVQALGGQPRKIVADATGPVAFLADGSRFAFVRKEKSILMAKADGSDERVIVTTENGRRYYRVAWSPDGGTIAAAAFSTEDSRDHLVEISVSSGKENVLPSEWLRVRGLAWLPDGSGLVISGRDRNTQLAQLWMVSYPAGMPRRITNDLSSYQGLSIAADGRTVASVQENTLSNVWSVSAAGEGERRLTTELGRDEGMSGIALARDGAIVYTVRLRGQQDLWTINGSGTGNRQLTFDAQSNFSPTVSADGRYIVFVSTRSGSPEIWRSDIDGANPVQLTREPGTKAEPSISPDGSWVAYQVLNDRNESAIWRVAINGGEPAQLLQAPAVKPVISYDGRLMAFERPSPSGSKIGVLDLGPAGNIREFEMPAAPRSRTLRWSADSGSLIYADNRDGIYNLWSQPLNGGAPVQLTRFSSDRIFRFDVARDGSSYAVARGNQTSDVIMITNFR